MCKKVHKRVKNGAAQRFGKEAWKEVGAGEEERNLYLREKRFLGGPVCKMCDKKGQCEGGGARRGVGVSLRGRQGSRTRKESASRKWRQACKRGARDSKCARAGEREAHCRE